MHILSNVLDIGDRYYDLNKFADLVATTIAGYNEFVCVEPLFCTADIDSRPARFFKRLQIEPYSRFSAGKGEFVQGQTWICALLLGMADKREKAQGMAVVCLNDKWGLIDRTGKELFALKYKVYFTEGLAKIRLNGKWGFINKSGRIVIPPRYDGFQIFEKGIIRIKLNGKWGFIDKTRQIVISPKYDELGWPFDEGLTEIRLNDKWGIINLKGEIVVPAKYDEIHLIR